MSKPILSRIRPFDVNVALSEDGYPLKTSTNENVCLVIDYLFQGTFQQFQNEIQIFNANGTKIYSKKYDNMRYKFLLAVGAIPNGGTYTVQVRAYGKPNTGTPQDVSPWSDPVQCKTLTTPTFEFNNLHQDQQINNSNYTLSINYSQIQGELLNNYSVYLYDVGMQLIYNSGRLSPSSGMTYTIQSLIDNEGYYVKAIGETVNGMIIETDTIRISIEYVNPAQYVLIELTNHPDDGAVGINSNIIIIDGTSNPFPPIYINNEEVDLRDPTHWVMWDKGFNFKNDFLIKIDFRNPRSGATFFEMSDQHGGRLYVEKWDGIYEKTSTESYLILYADNGVVRYVTKSNLLGYTYSNRTRAVIRKEQYLYEITYSRL